MYEKRRGWIERVKDDIREMTDVRGEMMDCK